MSTQAGVRILTSPQLSDCVFDWIPLESQAYMLKFKIKKQSLHQIQVYAPTAVSEYQACCKWMMLNRLTVKMCFHSLKRQKI